MIKADFRRKEKIILFFLCILYLVINKVDFRLRTEICTRHTHPSPACGRRHLPSLREGARYRGIEEI
jgi:hypothetical protein